MIQIQNNHVELDLGKKVGLGWTISGMGIENGGPVIWRAGASMYHRSRIVYLPEKKLGAVVMANDSSAWEAVENIAEKAMQLALESIYGIKQPEKSKQAKQITAYGYNDDFAAYYNSFLGYIPVRINQDDIKAELLGWNIHIKPDSSGWYTLQYDLLGFIPIDISWITDVKIKAAKIAGQRVIIVMYKGTQHLFASDFETKKANENWQKRLGEYEIANADVLTEEMEIERGDLIMENGNLFFVYELPMFIGFELKVPLKILNDNLAIIPGLGTALNESITIVKIDNEEMLEYSGYILKKKRRKSFF